MRNGLSLFSDYVHGLNAVAVDGDVDALTGWAVERLSNILGFDCAWYGWAEIDRTSVEIHASATRNLPEGYFEFWCGIATEDILAATIRERPDSVATYDRASGSQTDGMQTLADTFGLRRMATAMRLRQERAASLFVSAYRGGATAPRWEDEEREFLRCAVDQISTAARIAAAKDALAQSGETATVVLSDDGVAIVGLASMREKFGHLWSRTQGDRVPRALSQYVGSAGEHLLIDSGLVAICEPMRSSGGLSLRKLSLRPMTRSDLLTPRERQVAGLLADGLSHKEVARHLGIAPSTVRNQTQAIYAKLEVDNRASLATAIRDPA
ncbi:MAG: LuxR C-terminal-related transcriptional regulator [Pseudomonadota bacterium]